MPDHSDLDSKYFIDEHVYNCPFCNRRNVSYEIVGSFEFDWSDSKKCYVYLAQCQSCNNESMHLTFKNIELQQLYYANRYRFKGNFQEIDDIFFYSVPTSFFSLNSKIPRIIRELFTEAEGCLKSNFLTGASACARKMIYELALLEGAQGNNYDERIKALKAIKKEIDPAFFDTLLTIQELTSEKVHENAYDNWESKHIRLILAALLEIFNEIYVIPKLRKEKRKSLLELKENILKGKKNKSENSSKSNQNSKKDNPE